MRAVSSFGQIFSGGIMCRKSLLVRTVISHFVEIGEVLKIETCSLLLLESIEGVTSFTIYFFCRSWKRFLCSNAYSKHL